MPSEIRERLGFIPVMDTSPSTLHLNKQMHDDALDFESVAEDKRKRAIATSAVLGLGILSGLYAKSKVPMEVIEKHTLPVVSSLVGSAGQMAAGYGAVGLMQKDKSKEELLKYLAGIGLGTCLAYRYAFKPSAPFVPNKANIAGTIAPALIYGAMHFIAKDRVDKNNAMERALPPTKYLVPRVLKKYVDDNGGAEKTAAYNRVPTEAEVNAHFDKRRAVVEHLADLAQLNRKKRMASVIGGLGLAGVGAVASYKHLPKKYQIAGGLASLVAGGSIASLGNDVYKGTAGIKPKKDLVAHNEERRKVWLDIARTKGVVAEKTAYHPAEDYSGADQIKHASSNRYAELVKFVRKSKNAGKNVFTTEAQRETEEANKKVKKDNQDIAFRKGIAAGASAAEKVMAEGKKKTVKGKKKPLKGKKKQVIQKKAFLNKVAISNKLVAKTLLNTLEKSRYD